jgi:hypothetical protein
MSLTVLSVAYPFVPVGPDSVGGAEQVVSALDRALVQAGHHSVVVACEGSDVAGTLAPVPAPAGLIDDRVRDEAWLQHRAAIAQAQARWPVDLVHLHGIDFSAYLPEPGVPVLATLHLPPAWYSAEALRPERPHTWLHCVSAAQHAACPPSPSLLGTNRERRSVRGPAGPPRQAPIRARAWTDLPREGDPPRGGGREAGRYRPDHRRRGFRLRDAPALFRGGGSAEA